MLDDWIDLDHKKLHPAIYKCVACKKPVAYGDNYCSNCGIKFHPAHVARMIKIKNHVLRNDAIIFGLIVGLLIIISAFTPLNPWTD